MTKEFDLAKYNKLFVSESREYLRTLNESMVELESNPDNKELIDKMFRACHTVKGMAAMMKFDALMNTAHALEDVLEAVRAGRLKPEGEVADVIYRGIDAVEAMVSSVEKGELMGEIPGLIEELRGAISATPSTPSKPTETKEVEPQAPKKKALTTIKIKLGRKCSLPSARALVIIKELEKSSQVLETIPTEEEIEREKAFEELLVTVAPGTNIENSLKRISAMPDVEDMTIGSTGEPDEKWRRIPKADVPLTGEREAQVIQTVKVSMDKLDELLDDVGELVIGRSRLVERSLHADDPALNDITMLIDKLTSEIQSKVLGIRMIPIDTVMGRFPRMVRDQSKSLGKEVELIIEGGAIELDRTVVDKISDPIMHIIRNSIDHGIETPEEREMAGKRPKGLIRIVASKQQDHVLIEVSDDGRGIDLDAVRQAAIERGVLTKEEARDATGRDLVDLLFRPGFSTKKEVTETSGRGVGLDVVKKGVEELGGSVMLNTTKGAGTTISLWLPFTLAIIDAMMVSIAGQTYAVPMGVVVESHSYEAWEIKKIRNREVVQLRGEVLPLIRVKDFFGIKGDDKPAGTKAIIIQSRERRAALGVDELLGHQQIVVKSLDKRLRRTKGISGGTVLGSGNIALILDVDSILGG